MMGGGEEQESRGWRVRDIGTKWILYWLGKEAGSVCHMSSTPQSWETFWLWSWGWTLAVVIH
jgi:hypothetical protein